MNLDDLYALFRKHPCITTDSRNCPPGSLFFALKGDTFDGNRFAAQALESGCTYAIVDNPAEQKDFNGQRTRHPATPCNASSPKARDSHYRYYGNKRQNNDKRITRHGTFGKIQDASYARELQQSYRCAADLASPYGRT